MFFHALAQPSLPPKITIPNFQRAKHTTTISSTRSVPIYTHSRSPSRDNKLDKAPKTRARKIHPRAFVSLNYPSLHPNSPPSCLPPPPPSNKDSSLQYSTTAVAAERPGRGHISYAGRHDNMLRYQNYCGLAPIHREPARTG